LRFEDLNGLRCEWFEWLSCGGIDSNSLYDSFVGVKMQFELSESTNQLVNQAMSLAKCGRIFSC